MKKKLLSIFISLILVISVFSVASFGDFGDFAGDSDWGYDSGSDWGGSSDWGDSGWDNSGWNSGYGNGGYYFYDGGSSSQGEEGGGIPLVLIVGIVIVVIVAAGVLGKSGMNGSNTRRNVTIQQPKPSEPLVNDIDKLKAKDKNFSENKFLDDASNLYVRLQDAWTNRDLTPVRNKLSAELYAKSDRQIQNYIKNNQTNHVENVSVLNCEIIGCTNDGVNDIITVKTLARIVDYTTDDNTGNVIRGDRNREVFMTYHWTFIRSLDQTSRVAGESDGKHCPNCGAPVDLNQSAVCAYCGSVLESGSYDWVLSNIKGISQQSS